MLISGQCRKQDHCQKSFHRAGPLAVQRLALHRFEIIRTGTYGACIHHPHLRCGEKVILHGRQENLPIDEGGLQFTIMPDDKIVMWRHQF